VGRLLATLCWSAIPIWTCAADIPPRKQRLRIGAINEMELKGTKWFFYLPKKLKRDRRSPLPVVVSVHGADANLEAARGCAEWFLTFAERRRIAVIAPHFTENHPWYQALTIGGNRADLRLLEILEDAKSRVPPLFIKRIYLFGHSGGAQFAHRFALVHPGRVLKGAASAAGGWTFPKPDLIYPGGTKPRRDPLPEFQFASFVQMPFAILVGDRTRRRCRMANWTMARTDMSGQRTSTGR